MRWTGRRPAPHDPPTAPLGRRFEAREAYSTWLVLGLAAPFGLAVLLYPLAWWPVWAVVLPLLKVLWAILSGILFLSGFAQSGPAAAPPPPGGPMPWEIGPFLSPQVALSWALAFLVARSLLARLTGRERPAPYPETPSRNGFRMGLRAALGVAFLIAIWWLNRTLVLA